MEHLQTTEKVHDELLLHRRVDLLLRTGKLLVESLADTNRVVRNMKRTAAFLGIPEEKLWVFRKKNFTSMSALPCLW